MASGVDISIEQSTPLSELKETLQTAYEILTDVEDLAEEVVFPHARQHAQKAYSTKGRAIGKPWKDYSGEPAYRAFKAAILDRFDGPDDYDDSDVMSAQPGSLMRWAPEGDEWLYPSLTQESDPRQITDVDEQSMTIRFGTSVPWARRVAVTGGTNPFGESYPPRPIFHFNDTQQRALEIDIDQHFRQRLHREGVLE